MKLIDEENFEQELELMKELKGHKNVIRLLGLCTCKFDICLLVLHIIELFMFFLITVMVGKLVSLLVRNKT